jgi:hypothetical protein
MLIAVTTQEVSQSGYREEDVFNSRGSYEQMIE